MPVGSGRKVPSFNVPHRMCFMNTVIINAGATMAELPKYIIEVCTQRVNSFTHSLYRW